MNFRPHILAASALALFISGCSQAPANLTPPPLAPQFGSAGFDSARDVATNGAHPYVFVSGTRTSTTSTDVFTFFVRRYNRNGSLAWERRSPPFSAEDYTGGRSAPTRRVTPMLPTAA